MNSMELMFQRIIDKSLVMVAIPRGTLADVESAIKKSCGLSIPKMEQSTESSDSSVLRLWRLQNNQVLAYFSYDGDDSESHLKTKFNASAYYH